MELTADGEAVISYFDLTTWSVKLARQSGAEWKIETVEKLDPLEYTAKRLSHFPSIPRWNWIAMEIPGWRISRRFPKARCAQPISTARNGVFRRLANLAR